METMIFIEGGSFMMGDVFGEGQENEQPVHRVTLDDFYLAKYAVTVAQFRLFVEETGYGTSAEGPDDSLGAREKLMAQYSSSELSEQEIKDFEDYIPIFRTSPLYFRVISGPSPSQSQTVR